MITYYYRVDEFMTTFEKDEPNYDHCEEFKGSDLLECRKKAVEYYERQLDAIDKKGNFFGKTFELPSRNFKKGINASFSLKLVLVECTPLGEEIDHHIAGFDEESMKEGRQIEVLVFKDLGIALSYKSRE